MTFKALLNLALAISSNPSSRTVWNKKWEEWECEAEPGNLYRQVRLGFPSGSDSKASVYNAGDLGSIPGWGRSAGEGNGNPLQYYCLENPMDRGAWKAIVHGVAKSRTWLSDFTSLHLRLGSISILTMTLHRHGNSHLPRQLTMY